VAPVYLHFFPTRRSSDLVVSRGRRLAARVPGGRACLHPDGARPPRCVTRRQHRRLRSDTGGRAGGVSMKSFLWLVLVLGGTAARSEEHTSELQSRVELVC